MHFYRSSAWIIHFLKASSHSSAIGVEHATDGTEGTVAAAFHLGNALQK
jgi:hypothetical protein